MNCHNEKLMAQPTNAESSREETLRSSDVVAELEAARERVLALMARKDEWESWELFNLKEASNALRLAAKQKRSRSATEKMSHAAGSERGDGNKTL